MKKFKSIVQLFMALVMTVTSVFGNAFVVYADTNPDAGKVTATKTAERIGDETSRSAKVKISVSGNGYTTSVQSEREIILVLDASKSMLSRIDSSSTTKLASLKTAAASFIEGLLTTENAGKIKIGIVWYNRTESTICALSDNIETLKACINDEQSNYGTNIQAGIKKAKSLFTNSDNEKNMLILSDGEPNKYINARGEAVEASFADASTYAKNEISTFTGRVYTIGFDVSTNSNAENLLKALAKNGGAYYSAADATKLNDAFKAISTDIDVVAKNLTITDTVPNTFNVDIDALKSTYGDAVIITTDENGQSIITYKFDKLSSKNTEELEFTVTAKEDYYGSMYTNNGATVTGTANDGNKFYEAVNGEINENLLDPVVPIASRTKDDAYETKTNEELVVDTDTGIKSNDYNGKQEDEAESVLDEIIIVNETKYGSLQLNSDGSLVYNPNLNYRGNDSFQYYIKTTITDKSGNTKLAKSNVSTVNITINGVQTNYTVNYLEKGTNKVLAPSKTVSTNANNENLYVGDKVTEYALTLDNYNLVSNSPETITLAKEGNVINFYYELKDSKIIVHYLEKDTNKKLADNDTFDGKVTETKVITAKDIKDYVVVGSETQNAIFDLTTNEYTFYYEKAESAGAVAHHYIIDNNGNKTTDKLFNDDIASGKIDEAFSFSPKTENLGDYEYVESKGTTSGTLTSEKQEVIFYYQLKMTDVTVRYVTIKNGNVIDLINPVKDTGRINDNYTAYAKDEKDDALFANYDLESATEQTIKLKSSDNTITFVYTLKDAKIIVHYVEKVTNKPLASDKEFTGKVTEKFDISAIDIPKYTAIGTTSYNGEYTLETKEYTFYYEKKESAGVVAHHYIIDEDGNKTTDKLFDDDIVTGKLDDEYSFSAKTDLGAYEFVESTGKVSGVLTDETQEVIFYYQLKSAKVIVRHYEEGTTIKVADDETINGKVSKDYTTKEANVYGYTLVSTPKNAGGKFTDEVIEVIYYYKKDMGKVITRYVDEDGKVLLEETTTNGQVGTDYQTSPATITDYELINTIGEEKGKYTKEDIIVTYVYQYVMGEGGDDTPKEPEIPYTGIENDSYILEYSLMGTSALGLILLAILKKKFN